MEDGKIIVIGASAGGFEVIKSIVADLPANLNAAVFIVWHTSPDVRGILPQILNKLNTLHAANAVDNEPITNGRIYTAPPDRHLLVEKNRVRVTKGPRENRFRPAVDPLFRSAAYEYGRQVIGVILSGALDDGTAGLWIVKKRGGITIVQDPLDAQVPSMPESAIRAVRPDFILPVNEIAAQLVVLCNQPSRENTEPVMEEDKKLKTEIRIAMAEEALEQGVLTLGQLSPYTCPECHGVLANLQEGNHLRFRCHTGHAFSADSLLANLTENIEESLWNAIREVEESIILLNHMGDHFAEANDPGLAAVYFKKASEAHQRIKLVRQAVLTHEQFKCRQH